MSYTVLARKYRPQTFSDLVGQDHVSRTIGNAIESGRVAHAFLFTGARGVGKTTTARLLAKALNCEKGPTPEPCNECDPCKEITLGTDMDVLEMDGASNNSVEDVRRLQETLPYRPARDRHKVVIVDEVHMLSAGAFNAFLKTLEEPPEHVKFIFATTEIHKVPITIRSRCQRHDFRLIPHHVVSARVREILRQENIEADDAAVTIVSREAAGSLRDALTVLDQLLAFGGGKLEGEAVARGLGIAERGSVMDLMHWLLSGDPAGCLKGVNGLGAQGLDMLHLARQLVELSRDLVVLSVVGDDHELVQLVDDERQRAQGIANDHSSQELERAFAGLSQLVEEVGQSANPQLTLEMGLVRLADRPRLEPLAELLDKVEALEGRLGGGTPTRAAPTEDRPAPQPKRQPEPRREPGQSAVTSEAARPAAAPPAAPRSRPTQARPTPSTPQPPPTQPPPPAALPTPPAAELQEIATRVLENVQPEWLAIVDNLKNAQPALGAVLEHGVPVTVSKESLRIRFPRDSFFGRQASAKVAQDAILRAASEVLGERPALQIVAGAGDEGGTTVAAVEARQQEDAREKTRQAALNHPTVRDAMELFPEAEGNVQVELD